MADLIDALKRDQNRFDFLKPQGGNAAPPRTQKPQQKPENPIQKTVREVGETIKQNKGEKVTDRVINTKYGAFKVKHTGELTPAQYNFYKKDIEDNLESQGQSKPAKGSWDQPLDTSPPRTYQGDLQEGLDGVENALSKGWEIGKRSAFGGPLGMVMGDNSIPDQYSKKIRSVSEFVKSKIEDPFLEGGWAGQKQLSQAEQDSITREQSYRLSPESGFTGINPNAVVDPMIHPISGYASGVADVIDPKAGPVETALGALSTAGGVMGGIELAEGAMGLMQGLRGAKIPSKTPVSDMVKAKFDAAEPPKPVFTPTEDPNYNPGPQLNIVKTAEQGKPVISTKADSNEVAKPSVSDYVNNQVEHGSATVAEPAMAASTTPPPEVTPPAVAPTPKEPGDLVATANKITSEIRQRVGLGDKAAVETKTLSDMAEEAKAIDGDALIKDVNEKPRTLTDAEEIALGAKLSETSGAYDDALSNYDEAAKSGTLTRDIADRLETARANLEEVITAAEKGATEWGRSGVARQALIRSDYSTEGVLKRAIKQAEERGVPVDPETKAALEDSARRIKEQDARISDLEEQLKTTGVSDSEASPARVRRAVKTKKLEDDYHSIISEIKKVKEAPHKGLTGRARSRRGGAIYVGKTPKLLALYGELGWNLAQRGAMKFADIWEQASQIAKDAGHKISKQEFIDAMDDARQKRLIQRSKSAAKTDLEARRSLNKEIEKGSTRGQEKAKARLQEAADKKVKADAEREATQKLIQAKREAEQAAKNAAKAEKAEEIAKWKAEEKAKRAAEQEARTQLNKVKRQTAAEIRSEKGKMYEDLFGPYNRDEVALARMEGQIKDFNMMLESGDLYGTGKTKRTSTLQDMIDLKKFQRDKLRNEVDARINDLGKPGWKKLLEEGWNMTRGLKLGQDFGALGRQGYDVLLVHPKSWLKGLSEGIQSMSKLRADVLNRRVIESEAGLRWAKDGLALDKIGAHGEEGFASKLLNSTIYAPFERFHVAFQNASRLSLAEYMAKAGNLTTAERESIASLINAMTGRGDWGKNLGKLGNVFTAPKMYAGHAEVMTAWLNPKYSPFSSKATPAVKAIVARRTLGRLAILGTLYEVAPQFGWTFSINPDDSDYLKLRKGDVVLDIGGGYTPYYRAVMSTLNDLSSGSRKHSTDALKTTERLAESKMAPGLSFLYGASKGKNIVGEPVFADKQGNRTFKDADSWMNTLGSVTANDIFDMLAHKDTKYTGVNEAGKAALTGAASVGVGVQSYKYKGPKQGNFSATALGQLYKMLNLRVR